MDIELSRNKKATLNLASVVYGTQGVDLDDPAELYHEASTLYPSQIERQMSGIGVLERSPQLRLTASRSSKRYPHVPTIALPAAAWPEMPFAQILAKRRSRAPASSTPLAVNALSGVLHSAMGITSSFGLAPHGEQCFRTTPSGGALYPSEIYVLAFAVEGVPAGLHHFDPFERVLEVIRPGDHRSELCAALPMAHLTEKCAAALVITSMFWRTRFKYGQRGYRFALLEAGHLVQNIVLAATALDLASLPVGGFYDRALADLLMIDGINEAPLYVVPLGARA
jgi:SagB-type dehydrogenase family enzyme